MKFIFFPFFNDGDDDEDDDGDNDGDDDNDEHFRSREISKVDAIFSIGLIMITSIHI